MVVGDGLKEKQTALDLRLARFENTGPVIQRLSKRIRTLREGLEVSIPTTINAGLPLTLYEK